MSPKYNHENFGDVQNHIFAKGVITAVDSTNDTADVTVEGYQSGSDTPLFYHCEPDSEEAPNGSIEGAAAAFRVDDEVIVMLEVGGDPVRIVGFVDGIKSCVGGYLLLKATSFGSGHWFSLWDIVGEETVDSLTFTPDEEEIVLTFPMEAKLDRDVYTNEEVDDDPLYKWLMTRTSDSDEESDELPEVALTDTIIFSGGQQARLEYDLPSTPAFECYTASCYAGHESDSCIWQVEDSVPSRNKWETDYGLENAIIWTMNSTCSKTSSPYSSIYDHTYNRTANIPALREADYDYPTVSDSLKPRMGRKLKGRAARGWVL